MGDRWMAVDETRDGERKDGREDDRAEAGLALDAGTPDPEAVVAVLCATPARRIVGAGMVGALGLFTLWLAGSQGPQQRGALILFALAGCVALYAAVRMWRATAVTLELTGIELREAGGRRLASVADIRAVSRGTFAFKPSNGFVLRLSQAEPFAWAPGLWWRIGSRVGIGGVTPAHPGRAMAELLAGMIAAR